MSNIYETAGGPPAEWCNPLNQSLEAAKLSETAGGIGELGNPRRESIEKGVFSFDENQINLLEETLPSEGIQTFEDLEKANIQELVEAVDNRVRSIRPDLPTNVNMSHFGEESDVWNAFRHKLEPQYLEAPSDKIQQEQIAATMFDMDDLSFENWTKLSVKGKVEVLNNLERRIAAIEHRPAAEIRVEQMEPGLNGYQNEDGIALNEERFLRSDESPEVLQGVLETLIHEGRHMYQDYNVNVRQVHESDAEVNSWRENFEELGYASGDPIYFHVLGFNYTNEGLAHLGARLYYYQPVEIDARVFAADAMSEYRNKLIA